MTDTSSSAAPTPPHAHQPGTQHATERSGPRPGFLATALGLIAALHLLVGLHLSAAWPWDSPFVLGLTALLAASTLAIPLGLLGRRSASTRTDSLRAWAGGLALGWFSSLAVFTLLHALLHALLLAALGALGLDSSSWEGASAQGVVLLSLVATVLGLVLARRTPAIRHVPVAIEALPEALDGYRIAQITDIHVGATIRRPWLARVVERVNALQADLVAITGDVVDGSVSALREHVAPLQQLQASDGVALVIGNHELYSGAPAWVQEFRRLGLRVLLNEHFIAQRGTARIAIAGVTDHSTAHFHPHWASDAQAALAGVRADVRVLLAHQPRSAAAAAQAGADLALHGHTHGGQWWPWNLFVRLQQPVVRGLHRVGRMWSYTSVGTGYWGPPKRHFRSEITLLTLRRA
ncbi:MAG: metallophosphoesterase [Rhodoferax sp.]